MINQFAFELAYTLHSRRLQQAATRRLQREATASRPQRSLVGGMASFFNNVFNYIFKQTERKQL